MAGKPRTCVFAVTLGHPKLLHELFDQQPPMRRVPPAAPNAEAGLFDDLGSFGWLRNEHDRAIMLEIRHSDGLIRAYSYSWLESAEFNPSEGITLYFSGKTVKLVGRNLNAECRPGIRLFEGISRHRVLWIQVVDESKSMDTPEDEVIIDEALIT